MQQAALSFQSHINVMFTLCQKSAALYSEFPNIPPRNIVPKIATYSKGIQFASIEKCSMEQVGELMGNKDLLMDVRYLYGVLAVLIRRLKDQGSKDQVHRNSVPERHYARGGKVPDRFVEDLLMLGVLDEYREGIYQHVN